MAGNLKDILSNLPRDVDPETLLLYLQNKLPENQKHEVEKKLLDNEFADEALEGLKEFGDQTQINSLVEQLNADLRRKLEKKKQRRDKLRLKDQPWLYISLLIILFLIIIAYLAVHKLLFR
jgi:chromatin segregation and condensation protein Rec8/ScpA/Scc1 (kleisin family)